MAVVKGLQEKGVVKSHNLLHILRSKLLLIFSLVNFVIQSPLLIKVSVIIDNDLGLLTTSSVFGTFGPLCGLSDPASIQQKLNQDKDATVTLLYSQFATLLMVLVASFNDSFSPFFTICGFVAIQIMWTSIQVAEALVLRKILSSEVGCDELLDSQRLTMEVARLVLLILYLVVVIIFCWKIPKFLADARALTRSRRLTFAKAADNLFYISAYLWIGFAILFAAEVDVTAMSVSLVFVVVSLSISWFRLGWLSIHQRNGADPLIFLVIGITIILFFTTSRSTIQESSSWTFFMASWSLSIVLAIFSHVVAILATWYSWTNGDHVELPEQPDEPSFLPVTRPLSRNSLVGAPRNPRSPAAFVSTPLSPPLFPPSSTGFTSLQAENRTPTSSVGGTFYQPSVSEALRSTVRIESQVSSPPPVNSSARPITFSARPNGLAQTSVMRRPSERRVQDTSNSETGSVSNTIQDSASTPRIAPSALPPPPPLPPLSTIPLSVPSPPPPLPPLSTIPLSISPPPPLIIPSPPSFPQPDSPTDSDVSSQRPAAPSQPLSRPRTPPTSAMTPSSFRYIDSSRRRTRAPADVPVSPTRRDTIASDVTVETLPPYRSRSNTPIATESPPLPSSFNVPPMPPLPPNYPSLPSTPAQFLARRPTNSSVRTYATLPSYRSPTASTSNSETGSEIGDSAPSVSGSEGIRREEERLPIGNGRRSSQRSIMSVPRSVRR